MGDHGGWGAQPSGLLPNGLLQNEAASVTRVLDPERWFKAEERTAELIACIQPNPPSEERRNAVADYVQRLIMKCFSCQVFTFGSVPLKTYLPDGDIDLTAFSKNQDLKDTWASEVRDMLENEEKSENAEFHVKEVQYIQAEVKIIKCLVENIVVDISFNQLGGLCTLCFLEEVDHLINQNHLFKRSIILIKAWCYYESRVLGAHHGLISTYALETLVLYIFHVFNNNFAGPLEVLYRFLEFFSNFDWDNFCVSLWGPVAISSLPDISAETPRKDGGELLLSKIFLDACSSVYAVFPGGQENQGQPFISKHFNVIDPLRTNNNLGRSVSKGNFFRIRSAFAFGAKRLARLLDCPKENLIAEVNQFFMNTWDRHGSGNRPDAPSSDLWRLQPSNPDQIDGSENQRNHLRSKKSENVAGHESETQEMNTFHGMSSQQSAHPSEGMSRTSHVSAVSRTQSQKSSGNLNRSRISDQIAQNNSGNESLQNEKSQRSSNYSVNEVQGRYHFARTRSSPELTDASTEISTRGRRNRVSETVKNQITSARQDYSSRRKNLVGEVSGNHSARSSSDDPSSLQHSSSLQSLDVAADSNSVSNSYHDENGMGTMSEELSSVAETMEMHQEEQDLVNMMASSRIHSFNGQVQMPMNLASAHLPLPVSPSVLASMGYKISFRDRQASTTRNHRGSYNYDRNDHHGDREGNWNINSKQRATGRSHGRQQTEKPSSKPDRLAATDSRADRPWDSYRHDPYPSYQSQNGPFDSSSSLHSGSNNVAYGMYPLPSLNSNGITPTGPAVPSVVMLYSYDHNRGFGSPAEQLEFGSLGPVHFSGVNDVSHLGDGGPARSVYEQQRFQGGSARSSPDQPSSPRLHRSASQRNYQLKDEDFPPLSFPEQGGNFGGNNYNGKHSHYQAFLFSPHS
ncbi:uncharacterized protein LOC122082266 [Macadamia integrifolia]|uniref:uncharacterized protein LOC122082266 n=1 Tax=Macadamia integrifolia TaxID=60698 RepID=UPI001C4F048E|nr:uncharacterized protein LOC122082266 [Macadamia integrifolia]